MDIRKQVQKLTGDIYNLSHEYNTFGDADKFQELNSNVEKLNILLDLHSNKFRDSEVKDWVRG